MLEIKVKGAEFWNEETEEFVTVEPCTLMLEHSLISLSKWESKWKKPFLKDGPKTVEEIRDYVRCMTINKNVNENIYLALTATDLEMINTYVADTMTATTFHTRDGQARRGRGEIMTAEVIYFYMISFGIPFECEKWHLNRLITLIKVCNIKNAPKQKMSKAAAAKQQRALNAQRRAKSGSRG